MRFDSRNSVWENAVIRGYFALQAWVCANGQHLRLGELSCRAALSPVRSAMRYAVELIALRRIPTQIRNVVVRGVAIVVAALVPRCGRTDEGEKNQTMDAHHGGFIGLPQQHGLPIRWLFDLRRFQRASLCRSNAPKIRHLVSPFKPYYRKPFFGHASKYHTLGLGTS